MGKNVPVKMTKALIALGSNQKTQYGDGAETLRFAQKELAATGSVIRKSSRIYNSPAFPAGSGPDFANAVVSLDSPGGAAELLEFLHMIEARFGRVRDQRWGPRSLDLDLLAMGDQITPDAQTLQLWIDLPFELQSQTTPRELILPHPRLQDRAFVLLPMAEVAPDWVHPVLGKTVAELCAALPKYLRDDVVPVAEAGG